MAIDGISAVGAVGKSLDIGAIGATDATSATEGTSFVDALGKAFSDSRRARCRPAKRRRSKAFRAGWRPIRWLNSIMGAQRTLQSMLAIRDKAVSAYQEISRMAI